MKRYTILAIVLLILVTTTNLAAAANIGISPATIKFEDVLRGGYSEKVVTVTVDTESETEVEVQKRGEIANWIEFSKETFKVSKNNPYHLIINVTPPKDVQNANYTGFVRVKISPLDNSGYEGQATGKVNPVLDLFTTVEITDVEHISCRATNYVVHSAETGDDIKFKVKIRNTGNVRMTPRIKVDIWDIDQREILKTEEYQKTQISPTTEETVEFSLDSNELELGQYWVDVSAIDCFSQDTLTFDILEEGTLKANGKLVSINAVPWVELKKTTMIEAIFKNTGEKEVDAVFKGKIMKGERTIQLIESEKISVDIDEDYNYQFYFTPNEPGRYIISGRYYYDNKRTFEKSAIINVNVTGFKIKSLFKYLAYTVLLGAIIFLTYKIRQEKRNYKRKIGRIHR